jgi:hypothetical protein
MNHQLHDQPTTSTRWAPWWLYLATIVAANYLWRAVLPDASTPALRVLVALAFSAIVFLAITVTYRAIDRRGGPRVM